MKDLRVEAKKLKDAGKFNDAVNFYEQIWNKEADKWIGWEYVLCLKKCTPPRIDDAIEVSKQIYEAHQDFEYNKNQFAWLLGDKYFKIKQEIREWTS